MSRSPRVLPCIMAAAADRTGVGSGARGSPGTAATCLLAAGGRLGRAGEPPAVQRVADAGQGSARARGGAPSRFLWSLGLRRAGSMRGSPPGRPRWNAPAPGSSEAGESARPRASPIRPGHGTSARSGNPCPGRHLADEDQTQSLPRGVPRARTSWRGRRGSPRRESNPRPFAYKANALAAELRRRCRALGPGVLVRRRRQRGRRTSRTIVPSRGRGRPVDAGRMLSRGRRRRRGRPGSCRAARPARRPRRRPIRPA